MNKTNSSKTRSDALVLFGVTGDLAHKKIFPALYAMVKQGASRSQWSGRFLEVESGTIARHAEDGIRESGIIDDQPACDLLSLLRYIDGDYKDRVSSKRSKRRWVMPGAGTLPRHPTRVVRNGYQRARCRGPGRSGARHRRKTVRTRSGLRAGAQPYRAVGVSGRFDLPHRPLPRKGGDHEYPLFPLRQFVLEPI